MLKTRFIVGLISAFFLLSCTSGIDKPKDLISDEVMSEILYDIHVGDAVISHHQKIYQKHRAKVNAYYESIYLKYGVTREQFDASFDYYAFNPRVLDNIYEKVTQKVESKKAELAIKKSESDKAKESITAKDTIRHNADNNTIQ